MPITIGSMPPEAISSLVTNEFAAGASYVHLENVPFLELEGDAQKDYIRKVSSAIGKLSLSSADPASDIWRLDTVTSPSTCRIPYHTDNPFLARPEQVVGFWSVKTSDDGGENVLLPVEDVLDWASTSPEATELVEELKTTPITFTQGDHEATSPIIDAQTGIVRFDRRYVDAGNTTLANRFTGLLEGRFKQAQIVKASEGDVLFFNNRTLLHARETYTNLGRVSFRVRIEEL